MSEIADQQEPVELEVIDPKNPEKRFKLISVCMEHHSGPLPSPKTLKEYAEIFPGAEQRIFGWTEQEMNFRQEMCRQQLANERFEITEDHTTARRGQWFGFCLCLVVIAFGGVALLMGKEWSGSAAIISALGTLASAFMWSRKTQKAEEKKPAEKAEEIALAKQENSKP